MADACTWSGRPCVGEHGKLSSSNSATAEQLTVGAYDVTVMLDILDGGEGGLLLIHHNVLGGFLSLQPVAYDTGAGSVRLTDVAHRGQ
jgi:hypothetical protein